MLLVSLDSVNRCSIRHTHECEYAQIGLHKISWNRKSKWKNRRRELEFLINKGRCKTKIVVCARQNL